MNATSIHDYIHKIENENSIMKIDIEKYKKENLNLKENEKEMLKVSTIITTTNENIKLKRTIEILEKEINILRQNILSYTKRNQNNTLQLVKEPVGEELTQHIENTVTNVQNTVTNVQNTDNDVKNTDDDVKNTDNDVKFTDNDVKNTDNDVKNTDNDVKNTDNDVKNTDVDVENTVTNVQNTDVDVENTDDEEPLEDSVCVYEKITIKKTNYYIDDGLKLYEIVYDDDVESVGPQVGYRKFIEKKNKYKTVIF
jgi:hypothetical protein